MTLVSVELADPARLPLTTIGTMIVHHRKERDREREREGSSNFRRAHKSTPVIPLFMFSRARPANDSKRMIHPRGSPT